MAASTLLQTSMALWKVTLVCTSRVEMENNVINRARVREITNNKTETQERVETGGHNNDELGIICETCVGKATLLTSATLQLQQAWSWR